MKRLLERLYAARRAGMVMGLERIERCLAALGHPERRFAVRVHIGGTNGKGSTAAFVDSIARQCGRRTGLFTSPHLVQLGERFVVDGQPATPDAMVQAGETVARASGGNLTFFEQVTAMALVLFAEAEVEVAILEVGLGGRLDATTAVAAEVAAVTGVALDHQTYLGDTLEAIAAEKAGIFKAGQHAVIGRSGEAAAVPHVIEKARTAGVAALTVVEAPTPASMALGLAGDHQRDNAACALAIVDHLNTLGHLNADPDVCRRGLAAARLPGRLEYLAPGVVADGAHNPHAARALSAAMMKMPTPRIVVLAMSGDKDIIGVIRSLAHRADRIIATATTHDRAVPAGEIAAAVNAIRPDLPCEIAPQVATAIDRARWHAGLLDTSGPRPDAGPAPAAARGAQTAVVTAGTGGADTVKSGTVMVAGSLFLVGEAQQLLCGIKPDDISVSDPGIVIEPGNGSTES